MDARSQEKKIPLRDAYWIGGGLLLIDLLILTIALLLGSVHFPE
jgi:hypothetical protein